MEKKKIGFGFNRGVFCGPLVSEPVVDHEIKDRETEEVIRTIYKIELEVLFENHSKTVRDKSIIPFLVSDDMLKELGEVNVGDFIFVRGRWRAFNLVDEETGRKRTSPIGTVTKIEKVEEMTNTRNKIELHGYLKSKLYKVKFDEEGNILRDERGHLIPDLDENGERIPWTRRNHENQQVNDIVLLVKNEKVMNDGSVKLIHQDYIPAIGYGAVARQICDDIDINQMVKARGYVRRREKNGYPGEYVYEVVINRITALDEDGNPEETRDHSFKPQKEQEIDVDSSEDENKS